MAQSAVIAGTRAGEVVELLLRAGHGRAVYARCATAKYCRPLSGRFYPSCAPNHARNGTVSGSPLGRKKAGRGRRRCDCAPGREISPERVFSGKLTQGHAEPHLSGFGKNESGESQQHPSVKAICKVDIERLLVDRVLVDEDLTLPCCWAGSASSRRTAHTSESRDMTTGKPCPMKSSNTPMSDTSFSCASSTARRAQTKYRVSISLFEPTWSRKASRWRLCCRSAD